MEQVCITICKPFAKHNSYKVGGSVIHVLQISPVSLFVEKYSMISPLLNVQTCFLIIKWY